MLKRANVADEMTITIAQTETLHKKWQQAGDRAPEKFGDFLAQVSPVFGCDGAVTVPWCGMWLCIEKDGYSHS